MIDGTRRPGACVDGSGERTGSWHDEELAEVYTALGERDRALALIERAVAQHDALVVDFLVRPRLDPLRSGPRFQALMRRLAFPGHSREEASHRVKVKGVRVN